MMVSACRRYQDQDPSRKKEWVSPLPIAPSRCSRLFYGLRATDVMLSSNVYAGPMTVVRSKSSRYNEQDVH